MGPDRHVLTFPVDHGATLNLVAFVTSHEPWPADVAALTLPATKEEALKDFAGFGPNVLKLIQLIKSTPDRVSWRDFLRRTMWRMKGTRPLC